MTYKAYVAHQITGRMRIKLPRAKRNPTLLRRIQRLITPLTGVKRVEINPLTGCVLIHYDFDPRQDFFTILTRQAALAAVIALKPPELTDIEKIAAIIEAEAELLAAHSKAARSIISFIKQLNQEIRTGTNNMADLKVLTSLGLALYLFFETEAPAARPLMLGLGLFSFNSFVALHEPQPSVKVGPRLEICRR